MAASLSLATATPSNSPSNNNPEDGGSEIEVTLEPSNSQIQYDPSGAWSASGGSCTNGTRTTTQLGAKITFKFLGTEVSVSFVPKQDNVSVTVELDGLTIDEFNIPGQSPPQCQLANSWNRTLPSSTGEQQVSFIYNGSRASNFSKRGTSSLELGEIRYWTKSGSNSNQEIRHTVAPALVITTIMAAVFLITFS